METPTVFQINALKKIKPLELTPDSFKPFGDVIEIGNRPFELINQGFTRKYPALGDIDVGSEGVPQIHIFKASPLPIPFCLHSMEKHPLGSQTFLPANDNPFIVMVAPPGDVLREAEIRAFFTNGAQGVTYARDVWHHSLIAVDRVSDFYVIDRSGGDENLKVQNLDEPLELYYDFPFSE